MKLTPFQLELYNRNIILDEIGIVGQEKLLNSKILVIGAGGLGSPSLMYLAAAGVGVLGIADDDKVADTNLQRQIIHFRPDHSKPKVISAVDKIKQLNPDTKTQRYDFRINEENIENIIKFYDFILDCTDNFKSKYLINAACVKQEKPFSHGGLLRFQGQTFTIIPGQSACYQCVFREPIPEKEAVFSEKDGVIGPLPGIIGSIQAAEAIKYLVGFGQLLTDSLLTIDLKKMEFRKIPIKSNPECPICSKM